MWPHYFIYRGHERSPAAFEQLTVAEFVAGYIQVHDAANPGNRAFMLAHLKDLMEDSTLLGWASVRAFHGTLLQMFEQGRLTWSDTSQIQLLRQKHALSVFKPGTQDTQNGDGHASGPLFCLPFQEDKCSYTSDHATNRGFDKHVCAFCQKTVKRKYPHSETQYKRTERLSKNY